MCVCEDGLVGVGAPARPNQGMLNVLLLLLFPADFGNQRVTGLHRPMSSSAFSSRTNPGMATFEGGQQALRYEQALRVSLKPSHLCISDVSDGHTVQGVLDGRALHADGREILLLIVSEQFNTCSTLIERQRLVNDVLAEDLLSGRLHSVRMKCWTKAQWGAKGEPLTFSEDVPCSLSPKSVMGLPPVVDESMRLPPTTASTAAI